MYRYKVIVVPLLLLLTVLAACGGGQTLVTEEPADTQLATETPAVNLDVTETTDNPEVAEPVETVTADPVENVDPHEAEQEEREYSFTLDVLDDTYIWGGSADGYEIVYHPYDGDYPWVTSDDLAELVAEGNSPLDLPAEWEPDTVDEPELLAVEIWVKGAQNLKAFCCDLDFEYDSLCYYYSLNPATVDETIAQPFVIFTPPIYVGDQPVRHLQYMLNADETTGLNGDALLVTIMFKYESSVAPWTPGVAPPEGDWNQTSAEFDASAATLTWKYLNRGDYNQDGLVDWFNGAEVAYNFGAVAADPLSRLGLIAGLDEYVTIGDCTPIGMYLNTSVESYNIYAGDAADYPDGGELLDTVPLNAALGDPAAERLYFSYEVASPEEGASYWVKPVYDGTEGVASEITPD